MKFDTINKKPQLYNISATTMVMAAAIVVLAVTGNAGGEAISLVLLIYFILVLCFLIDAFLKQLRYNPYSYNTIYYSGFALFILFILSVNIVSTCLSIQRPEIYYGTNLLYMLESTAKLYMIASFPFVLLFSVVLCISNIALIRHEGRRFVNILGIILSILLTGGTVMLILLDHYTTGTIKQLIIREMITNLYAVIYLYFECMLVGAVIASLIVSDYEPDPDKRFIIILGCGIRDDGTATPLLQGRIDRALDFYRDQEAETGQTAVFVASGGQGTDETVSEAECIKRYLLKNGIPDEQILIEDQSTDTFENMKFSKEKIGAFEEVTAETKIAFSTTNYHVFRSGLYARRVKMRAEGMGARTRWYFWPNAWVREFVGLLTEHLGKQTLVLGGMTAIYAILTLLILR